MSQSMLGNFRRDPMNPGALYPIATPMETQVYRVQAETIALQHTADEFQRHAATLLVALASAVKLHDTASTEVRGALDYMYEVAYATERDTDGSAK